MKLSVFVVTYNQERYIRQCLESIVAQKMNFEYEVIIGDDCSTDGTGAICDEYAAKYPQIRVYHHPKNLGLLGNWEFVMNKCMGEYIALIEGDDYWIDKNKLQRQVDWLDAHPDYTLTFTRAKILYENGATPGAESNLPHLEEREYTIEEICSGVVTLSSSVMMRNVLQPVHYGEELLYADTYTFIELMSKGRGYGFAIPTVTYRVHKDNESQKGDFNFYKRLRRQSLYFCKQYPELAHIYKPISDEALKHLLHDKDHSLPYRIEWMKKHPKTIFSRFMLTTIWRYVLKVR